MHSPINTEIRNGGAASEARFVLWRIEVNPAESVEISHAHQDMTNERALDERYGVATESDAERKLKQSEERFRAFVTATSEVVYSMSPDWREMRYLVGKDFIADTTGPSNMWLERYIHPDDQQRVLAAIDAAIRSKSTFELEHRVIRADGSLGWTFSRAIPLLDSAGEVIEWFGAARDVTERKQREMALREADRRKDEFLAMLAHELRNPLAPMANALALLRHGARQDPVQETAREILERQLASLVRLVDDLREIARIGSGHLEMRVERVRLDTVVERAVETVRGFIQTRGHTLTVTLPPGQVEIDADPARLEQVLVNLLNNAAKYTDDGGRVDLAVTVARNQVHISIRDTGIGIEPELMPRLFEPFTQAVRSTARSNGGLGMGLSIVRRLVEMHGGTIEAHSTAGQGSEFIVRIPLKQVAAGTL